MHPGVLGYPEINGNIFKYSYLNLVHKWGPKLQYSNTIEYAHDSQSSRKNATPFHGTSPLACIPISLLLGSNLREKPKTASTSSPDKKSPINLHPKLGKTKQSPHVRESEIVLDSASHAMDSGFPPVTRFQILVSGTWILDCNRWWDSGFLELYCGFRSPGFWISKPKISEIQIPLHGAKIG